eukprot:9939866-Alexandrium_andersonii.AAC.1
MSASLVGSEMCIRDSPETHGDTQTHRHRRRDTHRHTEAQRHRDARRHTAVSYTHLTLPTICSV